MESIFQTRGGGGGGGHSSGGHTSTHTTTTVTRTVGGRTVFMPIIVPGGHATSSYTEQPAGNYPVEQVPAPVALGFVIVIFVGILFVLALAISES